MKVISNIGKYILMLSVVFSRPEKFKIFRKRVFNEIELIGINSIPIVALMSTFMGAVIALQTASNIDNPLLPDYTVGYITIGNGIQFRIKGNGLRGSGIGGASTNIRSHSPHSISCG